MNIIPFRNRTHGHDRPESDQPAGEHVEHVGQFGEFEETGTGTDLTLEWDSTDPDLHAHLAKGNHAAEDDAADLYRYSKEAGLPDA